MKLLSRWTRKIGLPCLILLFFVLSSCSLGANSTAASTSTPRATSGTAAQSLVVTQQETEEWNDPWTLMYRGVTVKIVSTDQEQSFPDDTDMSPRPTWVFRLNLQVTNPYKDEVDLYWNQAWQLQVPSKGYLLPTSFKQNEIQPGTTNNWLDFSLDRKVNLQDVELVVGELDELRITTALDKPGNLQYYRTKSITTNVKFEYGNSEWTIEKITSSTSTSYGDGTGGMQAKSDSRYITFQMKVTPRNNGADPDLWKIIRHNVFEPIYLTTRRSSQADSQTYKTGTLPKLISSDADNQEGTLVFAALVDDGGFPATLPVTMWLTFPANQTLHIGEVSIRFEI